MKEIKIGDRVKLDGWPEYVFTIVGYCDGSDDLFRCYSPELEKDGNGHTGNGYTKNYGCLNAKESRITLVEDTPQPAFRVGDVVKFKNGVRNNSIFKSQLPGSVAGHLIPFIDENGQWTFKGKENQGTVLAIRGDYSVVEWLDKNGNKPAMAFNTDNLILINNNDNDVRTTTKLDHPRGRSIEISNLTVQLARAGRPVGSRISDCPVAIKVRRADVRTNKSVLTD